MYLSYYNILINFESLTLEIYLFVIIRVYLSVLTIKEIST